MEESDNRAPQRIKNNFFRFKQFVVHQSLSGMKVTTEACLLGAKVPVENCKHILDIGSGTGLLSLMMAQRTQACITGVEIDEKAYQQSVENSKKSPFCSQIVFLNQSIQRFSETQMALLQRQYFDLIVSNPPFFTNHLQTSNPQYNQAAHTNTLSFEDLLQSVMILLADNGKFVLILPIYEMEVFTQIAMNEGLFKNEKYFIKHRSEAKVLREIAFFSKQKTLEIKQKELIIKDENENYTIDFITLLKEYYLIF